NAAPTKAEKQVAPHRAKKRAKPTCIESPSSESERQTEIQTVQLGVGVVLPVLEISLESDLLDRKVGEAGGDDPSGRGRIAHEPARNFIHRVEILEPAEDH